MLVSMLTSAHRDTLAPSAGVAALVRLLSACGGEEGRAGLGVLLCEVLTAVFLSLFVHGLATHSSAQLFRVLAHPLNSKLWMAVFGGGARLPTTTTSTPPPTGEWNQSETDL